jgi:hypothetical protein
MCPCCFELDVVAFPGFIRTRTESLHHGSIATRIVIGEETTVAAARHGMTGGNIWFDFAVGGDDSFAQLFSKNENDCH